MSNIFMPSLITAVLVSSGMLITAIRPSQAQSVGDRSLAQLFYPPVSEQSTLRVIGKGRASQQADKANLQFKFKSKTPLASPHEGIISLQDVQAEPLSEKTLQPIVDDLVAIGVPLDTITVRIIESRASALPFPFPSTGVEGGAEITVMVEKPTRNRLEQIVTITSDAASELETISLGNVDVQYTVNNCQLLEQTAYRSAVEDAQNRARSIAQAVGAKLKKVPSVAEPFYGIFLPGCNSEGNFPFGSGAVSNYDPNTPLEVEVTKEIFATYTVEQ